jgi:fructose-1,6-bisphosphatase II
VRYGRDRAITESLVMRSRSGTVRQVRSTHHLDRLARYSTIDYRHA